MENQPDNLKEPQIPEPSAPANDNIGGDNSPVLPAILITVIVMLLVAVLLGTVWFIWSEQNEEDLVEEELREEGVATEQDRDGVDEEEETEEESAEEELKEELIEEREVVVEQTGEFEELTFDFHRDLEIDNMVGDWLVVSIAKASSKIRPIRDPAAMEFSEDNFEVEFQGEVEIRGVISPERFAGMREKFGDIEVVCLEPDDEGLAALPTLEGVSTTPYFCFNDEYWQLLREDVEQGQGYAADVVVNSYPVRRYPSSYLTIAELQEIKALYPNYEIKE